MGIIKVPQVRSGTRRNPLGTRSTQIKLLTADKTHKAIDEAPKSVKWRRVPGAETSDTWIEWLIRRSKKTRRLELFEHIAVKTPIVSPGEKKTISEENRIPKFERFGKVSVKLIAAKGNLRFDRKHRIKFPLFLTALQFCLGKKGFFTGGSFNLKIHFTKNLKGDEHCLWKVLLRMKKTRNLRGN